MKDRTQNKCISFAIMMRVTMIGLKHMEFNIKVGAVKYLLEPSGRQGGTVQELPLQWFSHSNSKIDHYYFIHNNVCLLSATSPSGMSE